MIKYLIIALLASTAALADPIIVIRPPELVIRPPVVIEQPRVVVPRVRHCETRHYFERGHDVFVRDCH